MKEICGKVLDGFLSLPRGGQILIGIVMLVLLLIGSGKVFGHDPEAEAAELIWRSEGRIPDTYESAWHRTVVPQGDSYKDAVIIGHVSDGSIRVRYQDGPPACIWESPGLDHKYGGGRTLAQPGDEGWLFGGFGGRIYAVAGLTCEGFGIQLCGGIC